MVKLSCWTVTKEIFGELDEIQFDPFIISYRMLQTITVYVHTLKPFQKQDLYMR